MKSNKNDFLDAEAIAEAVIRQNMRFVPIKDRLKTEAQLDLQVCIGCAPVWYIAAPRSSNGMPENLPR